MPNLNTCNQCGGHTKNAAFCKSCIDWMQQERRLVAYRDGLAHSPKPPPLDIRPVERESDERL